MIGLVSPTNGVRSPSATTGLMARISFPQRSRGHAPISFKKRAQARFFPKSGDFERSWGWVGSSGLIPNRFSSSADNRRLRRSNHSLDSWPAGGLANPPDLNSIADQPV